MFLKNTIMRNLFQLLAFVSIIGTLEVKSQNPFVFNCNKDTTLACGTNCFNLKARIPNVHASSNDYVINPLSSTSCFSPYVESNTPGNPVTLTIDDRYSAVIPLPFSFKFYDVEYNSLVVSTNGYISFDVTNAGLFSHYSILNNNGTLSATTGNGQNLPSTLFDKALIMGPYHDLDPSVTTSPTQSIKYDIIGTAPHRKFVLSFYKVPLYNCNSLINNTHQIVLFEGTGIIEVFVNSKEICNSWNKGRAMIGIQNFDRDKGMVAPGRGAADPAWGGATLNESWRFVPALGASLYRGVELIDMQGNVVATAGASDTSSLTNGDLAVTFQNVCFSPTAPPLVTDTFIVKSKYESTITPGTFVFGVDTIRATRLGSPSAGTISAPATICTGTSASFSSSVGGGTWASDNTSVATVDPVTGLVTASGAGSVNISYTVPAAGICPAATSTQALTVLAGVTPAVLNGPATLCQGGTSVITADVAGGTWTTSNPAIATVTTTGTVTGVAAGTATISYTLTGPAGCAPVVSNWTLSITPPTPAVLTNTGNTTICATTTTTITASLSGGAWTSSSNAIATVNASGVVTGVSAGNATITYTLAGSGPGCTPATSTIVVTVAVTPNAGTLSGFQSITVGDLTSISTTGTAGGTWTSSNPAVGTVNSNGTVTALSAGTTTITYTVPANGACPGASSTILITVSQPSPQNGSFTFGCNQDTVLPNCSNPCLTLKARIPNIHTGTGDYVINPISAGGCFIPYTQTNTPGISANLTIDDRYSTVVNMPFFFPFYGDAASPYNKVILSTNGFLSFDVSKATNFSHWSMSAGNVPNTSYDRSLVMGVYHDLDPGVNPHPADMQTKYEVIGDAPYRRFIFSSHHVPLFSSACNNLVDNYHQIVLYESLGIIEVFVNGVNQCPGWNQGRKMIGLQNYNKDKGIMAPGRTATGPNWGTQNMNESWRFVPAAGPSAFLGVQLFDMQGNLVATGDTATLSNGDLGVTFNNVCLSNTTSDITKFVIKSKYKSLINPSVFVYGSDTLRVITKVVRFSDKTITNVKCKGESTGVIDVTATGGPVGATYQYSINGGAVQSNGFYPNLPAGTYNLHVIDVTGTACPKDTVINITEPAVGVDVNINQSNLFIPSSEQIQLTSTSSAGVNTIQWTSVPTDLTLSDPALANVTATPSVNTMYYMEGTDAIGCSDKDSVLVTVINTCLNVRNAFTPNGDGINDKWRVYDTRNCITDKLKVTVFNRYGTKVYESQDYWNLWDGTYKGSPLPDGTYYAVVEFYLPNKQLVVRKSDVTIIR